jgi:hypothetical protein
MRAIAIWLHWMISLRGGRWGAGVMLALALGTNTEARAGTEGMTSVEGEALAQMGLEALSQGVVAPGAWEGRAALIGLGVAGLYLGTSTAASAGRPRGAVRKAAFRLGLPLAGAALGSAIACAGPCDGQAEPMIGATAGALAAHVLDLETSATHGGTASPKFDWTLVVALSPGSYSFGIVGRF